MVNFTKTVYVNFTSLPFSQAVKLPILIYGKCAIHSLAGTITIASKDIHHGMIKIGYKEWDLFPQSFLPCQLFITGNLTFEGSAIISGGVGLFVQRKDATMVIGNSCHIGGGTLLKSMDNLSIGAHTSITGNCVVMNSNMHYVKNIETGMVQKPWGKIVIGQHCWINSGSVITKGSVIPNYSVTSRNSFLNKDYSQYGENLFLVGSPAKVASSKVQRIFSRKKELSFHDYFLNIHPEMDSLQLEPGVEVDD